MSGKKKVIVTKKVKNSKTEAKSMVDYQLVSGHVYGDTLELSSSLGTPGGPIMLKYDKDHMINRKTHEIKEIHHITSRADPKNFESLRATFKRLKRLIGANFKGGKSELWLTLTYKDSPMTDSDRLYKDFKRFMKRLRKLVGKYLAYIVVIEPQASGSLHAHLLLKTVDGSRLYIANSDVARCWGQGFVNVRRLSDADNISAYVMAYVSDVDLNNLNGSFDSKAPKRIVKGGRLALYPVGMQIYRRSRRGLVNPTKLKGFRGEIKAKYGIKGVAPDFYKYFDIEAEEYDEPLRIETEFYSIKKAKLKKALAKIEQSNLSKYDM